MRFAALSLAVLLLAGCAAQAGEAPVGSGASADNSPSTSATASVGLVDIGAGLQGPAGLAATVVATGLPNVASLAVDPAGRIWAGTAAFDDAGTDAIFVVAAGSAPVKVIGGLHTVLGLVWVGDTLYVASKESVTAWTGFAGTTFANHRTVVAFAAGVGEVNEIVLGPDGRLVVGISAPCNACITTDPDSAAIVSFLPDGSDLRILASGIRAPVGLAYRPDSDDLYVTMNQRDDLGDQTPGDWLALVRSGQDWGFPDCHGQVATACAAVPEPVAVLDTHAAASGVAIVTGELGATVGTAALVAEWARGVVLSVPLATGSSGTRTATPFLSGFQQPVPVIRAGRAVLVGDWGAGTVVRIAPAG
jgi:glucose/arabinose dehydrogenase